ncbi:TPA: hypothetical protein ACFU2Q_001907 [Neisseria subflava]
MKKNRFVKYLSDSIFGEYASTDKDYLIYINGIEVGSISPTELKELQYRVFYSSSLWWSIFKNLIGIFLKPAIIALTTLPLGALFLLWLNTDNPEAFNRVFIMLQDPAHFAKTMSGLFHLFYCISLFGTLVKLVLNQDSIFSIFDKELFENIQSYKKLKMRDPMMMDIVAVSD